MDAGCTRLYPPDARRSCGPLIMAHPDRIVLSVRDLRVGFVGEAGAPNGARRIRPVVDGISFEVSAGETLALLGESGCGKSVTALSLLRLLPPNARLLGGEVHFAGRELLGLPEADMRAVRGGGIAMIFQEPVTSLNPVLTIGRQIGEALEKHAGLRGGAVRARALELLDAVGIADAARRLSEYPFQLSGGMKQRVMIAIALAGSPRLLIADEPTTALDVTIQAQILDLLCQIQRERGMGILLITHDLGVAARMAQRIGVMRAGVLIETAAHESFFSRPRHPYTQRLFAALPDASWRRGRDERRECGENEENTTRNTACIGCPEACVPRAFQGTPSGKPVDTGLAGRATVDAARDATADGVADLVADLAADVAADGAARTDGLAAADAVARAGLPVPDAAQNAELDAAPDLAPDPTPPLLAVTDLRVHFPIRRGLLRRVVGHVKAVDGVSLTLRRGRTLALVGESGSGKTTAGKAILQLLRPGGNVRVEGSVRLDGRELVGQSRAALRSARRRMQMVFQDPFASLNPRLPVGEIIAEGMRALGVGGEGSGAAQSAERAAAVAALLVQVGLPEDAAWRYPHEFSGGQRQRIAIARALAVQPDLIICDEPTSALDVLVQSQILDLLKSLQERLGLTYLFITHNLAVVDALAHEVAVMYRGRIVEQGPVDAVLRSPQQPYTQRLLATVLEVPKPLPAPTAACKQEAAGEG